MESSTISPAMGRAVDAPTVSEALRRTAAGHPEIVAVRTADDSVSLTWSELLRRVDDVAGGLARLGIGRGDTVAIMLGNRPEFHIADLAAAMLGATPFSIYLTYPPEDIRYLIEDAGAKVAITEQAYLEPLLAARRDLPNLAHVIVVDGDAIDQTIALADVEGSNPGFDPTAASAEIRPDDLVTLIYTSGTTGPPKGVQLTHHNIMAAAETVEQVIRFAPRWPRDLMAARRPHRRAHGAPLHPGRLCRHDHLLPQPARGVSYLPRVRPTWFFAVPRIWEKLKAGLETMQAAQPDEQRRPIEDALKASLERVRLRQRGEPVPPELEAQVAKADEEMFSKLRAMLGLDQLIAVNVGAAPTPVEVLEFFHALGIELAELWGMSETCGAGTCNRPGEVKIGTVGPANPGVELKIADDGELLVRGECVMTGYRNAPEQTAEALDADGWLHTGDIGLIDDDGFLTIVDRKKELIINAAGKNMSPANIEARLKTSSPLIGQAICIGDSRPYNTALIVLDADFAPQWAAQHGIEDTTLEALAHDPHVRTAVEAAIEEANQHLSRVEQIKKLTIVPGDWLPGGDELTPTMKLKRRPIATKYAAEITAMYAGG